MNDQQTTTEHATEAQETPVEASVPDSATQKPKGRRSRRKSDPTQRQTGKEDVYAYTITDKTFGEFHVLNTANAWWAERTKVEHLIDAYKIDANDDEACAYAGISPRQHQYFQELHQDFCFVKSACRQVLGLKAKKALAEKIEREPEWYLERKRKDEYSTRSEVTGANGRDLYDGLTSEIRELGETLRSEKPHDHSSTTKEHAGDAATGNTDAGQDGSRHEATPAGDVLEGSSVPPQAGETV